MRLLVVNADDFGRSPAVNEGILQAHTGGIVTSTSLMVLEAAAVGGARAAAGCEDLSVGLHFVQEHNTDLDDPRQTARSFHRQLERFRELTGHDPTHVDSHHHVHSRAPTRLATFSELVEPLGVPLRGDGRVAYIGGFWAQSELGVTELRNVSRRFLLRLIATDVLDGFTELACHPALINGDFDSSYLNERAVELATLTGPGLREEVDALGAELVSYHAWTRRWV
jgi:predicted glycoside hydrolase/deacetylase ChbG (UPF0249 family)